MSSTFRSVTFCCIAMLTIPFTASAEPGSTFVKCEKMLAGKSHQHRQRSDKLRRKFDAKVDSLLRNAVSKNSAQGSSDDDLRDSVERIKKWRRVDQAYSAYVENVIEAVMQTAGEDSSDFECRERSIIHTTFDLNYQGYESALRLIEKEIKKRFELEDIRADEGLLVIAFNGSDATNFVRINRRDAITGSIVFGPTRRGEFFRVVRAKAGTYDWEEIEQKFYQSRRTFYLRNFDLSFVVEAGKLNYAGVFLFDVHSDGYFTATLNDRLIITLTALEQRYPELIEQYEIANGLYPDDRFTEFYLREKSLMNSEAANESHE